MTLNSEGRNTPGTFSEKLCLEARDVAQLHEALSLMTATHKTGHSNKHLVSQTLETEDRRSEVQGSSQAYKAWIYSQPTWN